MAIPTTTSKVFSLRDVDLGLLKNADQINAFISPRAGTVIQGNWARRGFKLGIGVNDPKWYPDDVSKRFQHISDLELDFERVRREIRPQSASRLCCIYLAEDSDDGRVMLNKMFGTQRFIASVKIDFLLRLTRSDSCWVDRYSKEKVPEFIKNYWLGLETEDPRIEYLLEGTISLENKEDYEIIEQNFDQIMQSGEYGNFDKNEWKKRLEKTE
jgi:hypothetical protein